jgi:ribosomal protein S18 acetylase RimI-like enzyme
VTEGTPAAYAVRALSPETWPDFAALVEANRGVWDGCWCLSFHGPYVRIPPDERRGAKEALVRTGRAQAALVYDGAACVGWAQYGPPRDLPRIKNLKTYAEAPAAPHDWRITCLFVDPGRRRRGVGEAAVRGALDLIGRAGGGVVEAYPEDVAGRKASSGFLWNGTLGLFERLGFARDRKIGKHKWVVRTTVPKEV